MTTLKPRVSVAGTQRVQPHHVERDRSTRFQRARFRFLSERPLCEYCQAQTPPRLSAAEILEHRVPLWAGGSMWDQANWAASCKACADAKTAREAGERAAGGGGSNV